MGDLRRRAWTVRRYGPGLTFIFLFGVWPRAGLAETPPDPAPKTPAAVGKQTGDLKNLPRPLDSIDESLRLHQDQLAAEQHALDQLLPRNREQDRLLERSRDQLKNRDYESAAANIQSILDTSGDCFTRQPTTSLATHRTDELSPSSHLPRSLRRTAEQLLSRSPKALASYRRLNQPYAASLLADAIAGNHLSGRELLQRFRLTHEAVDYTLQRVVVLVDTGRYNQARLALNEVAAIPDLSQKQIQKLSTLISLLPATHKPVRTADIRLVSTAAQPNAQSISNRRPSSRWQAPSANANGSNAFGPIGPVLAPQWSARHDESLASEQAELGKAILSSIRRWESEQDDHGPVAGPIGPQSPVIHNRTVIYRDYEGLIARNLDNGTVLWRVKSQGSIRSRLEQLEDAGERSLLECRLTIDSVAGELTSDDKHVYWVERGLDSEGVPTSRLVATSLDSGQPIWTVGSNDVSSAALDEGVQILSVPTPTIDGLIVAAEIRGRLELVALDAETGQRRWTQPIAVADVPATEDRLRMLMSCRPIVAAGRVICCTQLGTIVAVDTASGTLAWVYNYADVTAGRGGRPRSVAAREFNSRAYPNQPIITGSVVYAMPIQSADIVAISIETGRELWKVQRENDTTMSLVDTTAGQVVLVGDRFVRALDVNDGSEIWRTRVPTVVGRGVGVGRELMLPIATGQLLRVDLDQGNVVDDRWDRAARPEVDSPVANAGNLAIVKDYVVRVGPVSISVMPRSEMIVRQATRRLASHDDDAIAKAAIDLARVSLASAQPKAALKQLAAVSPQTLSSENRQEYEHLLRETLFASLPNDADHSIEPHRAFSRLHDLAKTPTQAARVMKHRITNALRNGQLEEAVNVARQLSTLTDGNRPGTFRRDCLNVTSRQLASSMLQALSDDDFEQLGIAEQAMKLARIDSGTSTVSTKARAEFLALFGRRPEAGLVRVAHAAQLVNEGQIQAAELQFLLAIRDGNDEARVHARLALAGLYARHNLPREAASVWQDLMRESEGRYFGGMTVGVQAASLTEDHPVAVVLRQRKPLDSAVYAASISFQSHEAPDWAEWYAEAQPKMSPKRGSGLDVLDAGKREDAPTLSRLLLIDQTTPVLRGSVDVPSYYWHPPSRVHRRTGQMMPIGFYDPIGISMLESRRLWSATENGLWHRIERPTRDHGVKVAIRNRSKVKVGPVHADAVVMQQRTRLFAVDPLSGDLLWARTDLDRSSGMEFDEASGLFGNADRTVAFDADGIGYQIFNTSTGELFARGRLAPRGTHIRRFRMTGSRRVLFIARIDDQYHYRIWDSAHPTAAPTVDIIAGATLLIDRVNDQYVGLVDRDSVFHYIDLDAGRTSFTCKLPEFDWEHVSGLNVFQQDGKVFVDIARSNTPMASQLPLSTTSIRVPSRSIGGHLIAIQPQENGAGKSFGQPT